MCCVFVISVQVLCCCDWFLYLCCVGVVVCPFGVFACLRSLCVCVCVFVACVGWLFVACVDVWMCCV